MHGLNTHGLTSLGVAAHPGMTGHEAALAVPGLALSTGSAVVDGLRDSADRGLHTGDLCLAILGSSLLTLLLGFRRARRPRMPLLLAPHTPEPARRARAPDPPCLIALSVRRC